MGQSIPEQPVCLPVECYVTLRSLARGDESAFDILIAKREIYLTDGMKTTVEFFAEAIQVFRTSKCPTCDSTVVFETAVGFGECYCPVDLLHFYDSRTIPVEN